MSPISNAFMNDSAAETINAEHRVPLCVDLDGTLVRTDILIESIFALLRRNVLYVLLLPFWLFKGKAHFKQQIAQRVDMDVRLLPYHRELLEYLTHQKRQGRHLVLATASDVKFANQIAMCLGLFDEVVASNGQTNLSGARKLDRLRAKFGERGFDYAGNTSVDLKIWTHARCALVVNANSGLVRTVERCTQSAKVFVDGRPTIKSYLRALRLQQWSKNALVFIPLIMAHKAHEAELLLLAFFAFLSFGLCASSVYLLNDILDLPADRQHPTKCDRPLASGTVSIVWAALLIPSLLLASFGIALILPTPFIKILACYYLLTLMYSVKLKQELLVDVLLLAGLYTIRIIAGGAAVSVDVSFWLLAFSMFFFLNLAMVKRYSELLGIRANGKNKLHGRSYEVVDVGTMAHFGISSGYVAVLVLALYINSEQIVALYSHPYYLWLLCPLISYWVSRTWLLARRGHIDEDPLVFATTDSRTYWVLAIGVTILWSAI